MNIICNFSGRFQIYRCLFSVISTLGDNYGIYGYFELCSFSAKRSRSPTIFNFQYLGNYWDFLNKTYIYIPYKMTFLMVYKSTRSVKFKKNYFDLYPECISLFTFY